MNFRLRAAGIHLGASIAAGAIACWLVFALWYAAPLAELAGGATLFAILVGVDLVMGPALTAVIANPRKSRRELTRDLAMIVLLQSAAFGYGIYTMAAARPVAIAFEVDLFRVVSAADVDETTLDLAPPALRKLSWTGPVMLMVVKPTQADEQFRSIELGLAGIPLAAMPRYWREYAPAAAQVVAACKPVAALLEKHPGQAAALAQMARRANLSVGDLKSATLLARRSEWVAVISPADARIVGYLPVTQD
jgi:hypothetical protein